NDIFFFSSRRRHTRSKRDWSSDVCSPIYGRQRKVVGHFARNGFYYSLDRTNGEFLRGGQYVNDLNWTKGLNAKTGKPLDYDQKRSEERRVGKECRSRWAENE